MKLTFEKIEIHNFMSFEDEIFDFSSFNGLTLIQGKNNDIPNSKNGSGKSALFSSILYCLYGQLQNKIKNENIVNRYTDDKDVRLVLNFKVDDIRYQIIRGLQRSKNSYLNFYRFDKDEKIDITKSSIQETQEFLESEIIHCDVSIFLRTILLTSDQNYNFYMLKKSDKKEFVEKLFDISVFGDMYAAIHKDLLTLDKNIISHQNQLLVLSKNTEDYENRIKTYDENKSAKKNQLIESIKNVKRQYEDYKKKEIKTNSDAVKKLEDASNKITEAKLKLQSQLRQSDLMINNAIKNITLLNSDIESKNSIISKHSELLQQLCDDCKPVYNKFHKLDVYLDKIEKNKKAVETLESDKNSETEKRKTIENKITEYDNKLKLADKKMKELTAESIKANREIALLESKLSSLKNEYEQNNNSVNPFVELFENNKESIRKENEILEKIGKKYNYLKFAENIVSQDTLRKFIIKDLVVLLNNKIKTYLMKLGAKYHVMFDENMDYEFITSNGESCEYGNFSAGERMRLLVATSFAFKDFMSIRNGLNSNILILDEYFDSAIDSLCVENIINILKDCNKTFKTSIYVISHRSECSLENFDHIIQVEKTDNISNVKVLS